MVISLDNEIIPYEPFGRSVIDRIPNNRTAHGLRKKQSSNRTPEKNAGNRHDDDDEFESIHFFNNDFTPAELDVTRDLFRSINEEYSSGINDCCFGNDTKKDFWKLRKSSKGEEEIYFKANTLLYSQKPLNNTGLSFLEKTFSFSENVLDAVWCEFTVNDVTKIQMPNQPGFENAKQVNKPSKKMQTLCVLDKYCIHVVSENGNYHRKLLPFQTSKLIATKHGLLMESDESVSFGSPLPAMFSLSHPLNEIFPVYFANGKSIQCPPNIGRVSFVDVIPEKNLAVLYCSKAKCHLIFYLRPVEKSDRCITDVSLQSEEMWHQKKIFECSPNLVSLSTSIENHPKPPQQLSYLTSSSLGRNLNNLFSMQPTTSRHISSPLVSASSATNLNLPFRSRHSMKSSELDLKNSLSHSHKSSGLISSRIDSPLSPSLNRLRSRLTNPDLNNLLNSDGPDSLSVNLSKSSFKTPNLSSMQSPAVASRSAKKFLPQNCSPNEAEYLLEFLWAESTATPFCISQPVTSKIFVIRDFLDQNYLCLLVRNKESFSSSNSVLKLIRFDEIAPEKDSQCKRPHYVFTSLKVLNVKDAEPLKSLNMIIVLDETNVLVLYSGPYQVAIVHLQPDACFLRPNTEIFKTDRTCTPVFPKDSRIHTPSQSFESDFLDFSPDVFQLKKRAFKVHASSPIFSIPNDSIPKPECDLSFSIQQYPTFGKIMNLRDPIDNRVTFETENGKMYRISFPLMATTFIVEKCLAAFRQTLPKEILLFFITTWYTYRNSTNAEEEIPEIILFKLCILSSIGFDKESLKKYYDAKKEIISSSNNTSFDPNESIKKIKIDDDDGTDEDFHKMLTETGNCFDFAKSPSIIDKNVKPMLKSEVFTGPGFLYPYVPHILYSLHLIYEDLKLIEMNWSLSSNLVDVLYFLALHMDLTHYQDNYFRDFWSICSEVSMDLNENFMENKEKIIYPYYFQKNPPSIYDTLFSLMKKQENDQRSKLPCFPYIGSGDVVSKNSIVTPNIFNFILLYSNLNQEFIHPQWILKPIGNTVQLGTDSVFVNTKKFKQMISIYLDTKNERTDPKEKILFLMSALGITQEYIKRLPFGLALPLWDIIFHFRMNPKNDWCSSLYSLIDRPDLLSLEQQPSFPKQAFRRDEYNFNIPRELEYLDHSVFRLLFPNDQRLLEAYRMLMSSRPMVISIKQRGMSDNEFAEEQEKHLLAQSFRTMALPIGRGMVTLRSYNPVVVERFPIPPLVLHGKIPPRHLIFLSHIDVPPNMNVWPLFHNGVSAGLRISSCPNKMINSSWILYNKPSNCSSADDHYEHAGFLLALGLNGLLDNLSIMDLHNYLSRGNDLTKVAILLGLSASRRGTMDSSVFVLLGIHLEGLLPSTSTELDVSPIVRVAAVLGTGFLFQGTGHRYISEVMLNEIGRPPGPEMDHYIDRESYALSAGLAFGLVTLGRGNELMNVRTSEGISIPDQLNHYMLGVHKKMSTLQKEKIKAPSYHIREGNRINADVTSPGATLALGMMFFNTGNKAIVQWLNVPDTQNLLEIVRPDFLLLRVLARNLILWSEIEPTNKWLEAQIPEIIYNNAFKIGNPKEKGLENEVMFQDTIDYETMAQSYCNIIAGACFSLALRYAGSANEFAYTLVFGYTFKLVTSIQKGQPARIEQAGRSTLESCINVLIVSSAIIMAGTGKVEIMRLCRFLRSRINQNHVLYGSFMAIHMALGLLFLGGCRMTLNSSPESVAALICAFFPKYPIHTNDNRYHLQAFRHLYVLATEPRLLVPTCINTGQALYSTIRYTFKDKSKRPVRKTAPCLLPELNLLDTVELIDTNYWRVSFQSGKNFDKLQNCLKLNGRLYIKRKVKGLNYNKQYIYSTSDNGNMVDSSKFKLEKMERKSVTLFDFTHEVIVKTFSGVFSFSFTTDQELQMKNKICSLLYDCAEDETLDLFVPLIQLISQYYLTFQCSRNQPDGFDSSGGFKSLIIWQIKMASHYIEQMNEKSVPKYRLIETIQFQMESRLKNEIDRKKLRQYLEKELPIQKCDPVILEAIVYFNLPFEKLTIAKDAKLLNIIKTIRSSTNCTRSAFFLRDLFIKN